MNKERSFKAGTILTDGKNLIYLGIMYERNWTPLNNYGRKNTDYGFCKTYPDNLFIGNCKVIQNNGGIPGLWFQKTYHLHHFRRIDKNLINPKILKELQIK